MARKSLSRQQVLAIRSQYEVGFGIVFLAREYGVSRNTISALVHGRTHRRVKEGAHAPLPSAEARTRAKLQRNVDEYGDAREARRLGLTVPGLKQGSLR